MNTNTPRATGILPDAVSRDPSANAYLFAIALQPNLDAAGVQGWLQQLTVLLTDLQAPTPEAGRLATATVAFGPTFFSAGSELRFGLTGVQIPAQLQALPPMPALAAATQVAGDILIYVMSTCEAAVAVFERGLSLSRVSTIASISVELGFQRADKREPFGFRDGLRNVESSRREDVIFLDPDRQPEEPAWAAGGSYLAYMKIRQDLDAMAAKPPAEQEAIIGRRKDDGSRLDLPPGTPPSAEGPFTDDTCPVAAHIRKAGPRGKLHDEIEIFRRGVPYLTLNPDGSIDAGLQFVSFQRSLQDFNVIFSRWVTNANFPLPGTGPDSLLAQGLISIEKYGFYFVAPEDTRYVGAAIFDAPAPDPCSVGHIVVQKQLLDTTGQPILAELGGIAFQILQEGQPLGRRFSTNSSGRAVSPPIPRGQQLAIHEVSPPTGFQPAADIPITLNSARELIAVTNDQTPGPGPGPNYSA